MEAKVVRFCPNCGTRVTGPESLFSSPCRCPSCDVRSQFYDYPNEPTTTPARTSSHLPTTWFDRLLWAAIGIVVLTSAVSIWLLVNGWATATLIAGVVCLLAGVACAGYVLRLQKTIDRAEKEKKKAERALMIGNSKLNAAAEVNRGFKANFEALVNEEKNRLQREYEGRLLKTKQMQTHVEQLVEEKEQVVPTIDAVGNRLLDETIQRLSRDLTASNLPESRMQLKQAINFCRENGCKIKNRQEEELLQQLDMDHRSSMLETKYTNERKMVESRMREEEKLITEVEESVRLAESERSSIAKSLSAILRDSENSSDTQIEDLREKLRLAEQKMSEASAPIHRPTAGFVYVLSNVGSLGEGIFNIGFTRLSDPRDHIEELSGLAVPFPYDVHMLVPSENAEELAAKICAELHDYRVNRFNHCKNFFKTDIKNIWQLFVAHHGTIDYVADAPAKEYSESLNMSKEAFQEMTDMHQKPEKYRDPFDPVGR